MRFTKAKVAVLEEVLNNDYCEYCGKEYRGITLSYDYRKPKGCRVLTACCEQRRKEAQRNVDACLTDKSMMGLLAIPLNVAIVATKWIDALVCQQTNKATCALTIFTVSSCKFLRKTMNDTPVQYYKAISPFLQSA